MDHCEIKPVPSLALESASRIINNQESWTSYLSKRSNKLKNTSRPYSTISDSSPSRRNRLKRLPEQPPPPLEASPSDVFIQFRELMDPKHTLMYLDNLWLKFESKKDENHFFRDLGSFFEVILAESALSWSKYHTHITQMRESQAENERLNLEKREEATFLGLKEDVRR